MTRFVAAFFLALCAFGALQLSLLPSLTAQCFAFATRPSAPTLTTLDKWLFFAPFALFPWIFVESFRAWRTFELYPPPTGSWLPNALFLPSVPMITYAYWAPALDSAHVPISKVLLLAVAPLSALTMLAWVCSVAFIGAVERGEIVGRRRKEAAVLILPGLVKAGGFLGVVLARRTFQHLDAVDDLPSTLPQWLPGIWAWILFANILLGPS